MFTPGVSVEDCACNVPAPENMSMTETALMQKERKRFICKLRNKMIEYDADYIIKILLIQ